MQLTCVILIASVVCACAIPLPSTVDVVPQSDESVQTGELVQGVPDYVVDALLQPLANLALAAVANDEGDATTTAAILDVVEPELGAVVNSEGQETSVEVEITKDLIRDASTVTEVTVTQEEETTELVRRSVAQDDVEGSITTVAPEVERVTHSARHEQLDESLEVTTDIAQETKSVFQVDLEDQPKVESLVHDEQQPEEPVTVIIDAEGSEEQVTVIITTDEKDGEVATHTLKNVPKNQLQNLSIVISN